MLQLSGAELAARLSTTIQNPNQMVYYVYENDAGQLVFPAPITPTVPVGGIGSDGRLYQGDSAGRMPVVEASAAATLTQATATPKLSHGLVSFWDAAGTAISTTWDANGWSAIAPVVVTADGAGAVTVSPVFGTPGAGVARDVLLYFVCDTTGNYLLDWIENTAAPAVTVPDWHSGPVTAPLVAGMTYGPFRIRATNDNVNMGWNTMANGSWPNAASLIMWGDQRAV